MGQSDDKDLRDAVRSRGFQPARADVDGLFDQLATAERDEADVAERALARLGPEAARQAIERFASARPPLRGRLCKLVGRICQTRGSAELRQFLLERLADEDDKTRRNAIIALGKLDGGEIEAALIARWPLGSVFEQRSLAAAFGKLGGPDALALLRGVQTEDRELRRITDEALLKLDRTIGRARHQAEGGIDASVAASGPLQVALHCRAGLARLVAAELPVALTPRVVNDELVTATLVGPLAQLFDSRIALKFAFPLPTAVEVKDPLVADLDKSGRAVVAALVSDEAKRVFGAFTRGAVRYRIEWAGAGHRRGLTFRCAQAVAKRRPELVNDPTASLWEVVVSEHRGVVSVELWPRGLADPRFAYRRAHVPASSHPTLAAALARVAGVQAGDVVWDPFLGAATELVERARLGATARMFGTDLDPTALELARTNLDAAGVTGVELVVGDAREWEPPVRPTLVLTNPPMGRRVLNKSLTGALYDAFLDHVGRVLAPGGRLVWLSPRAKDTTERALRAGLRETYRQQVDMGGFWAELQAFEKRGGSR